MVRIDRSIALVSVAVIVLAAACAPVAKQRDAKTFWPFVTERWARTELEGKLRRDPVSPSYACAEPVPPGR